MTRRQYFGLRISDCGLREATARRLLLTALCVLLLLITHPSLLITAVAQSATATLSGTVTDQNGGVIPGVEVTIVNTGTSLQRHATTNGEGYFTVPLLSPGTYTVTARGQGFAPIEIPNVILNVGDQKALQIQLKAGNINEAVTIQSDVPLLDTQSASVSTVVDRNFAENLPMNGRSFQTLIQLTPGVVLTAVNQGDSGQFSVNGQRASSNYWMVDGVSANFGLGTGYPPGNGVGGSLGSFSAQGGTNSLVSVDALQEFRIQTSTYAPEFGRTPGGQISIVTRSGTNQFHGSVFDYLRNDLFDANDWFANATNQPKPKERQNDFGGTFSGPIIRDKTFFFFSYEGLRLRLPQTALTTVPDLSARQSAVPAMQPFLNAYPLPNGPDDTTTGAAQFNASYSNSSTLNAYSLRIDHKLSSKLSLFGRYNYSPSDIVQRGGGFQVSLSSVSPSSVTTQTGTLGATWTISSVTVNDLRVNYSRANANSYFYLDSFGGAVPLSSLPLPSPYSSGNANFVMGSFSLAGGILEDGRLTHNIQRQINLIEDLLLQRGSHSLKFGVDYRRLSPVVQFPSYSQGAFFLDVPSMETGSNAFYSNLSSRTAYLLLRNLGVFAQDTWRFSPRLTLTYGIRWDLDFPPSTTSGPSFPAAVNFSDLASLALAPAGTPPFRTSYGIAPRLGVAYHVSQRGDRQTVLRGGFGVFFDLATQEVGNGLFAYAWPFGALSEGVDSFPLSPAAAAPPAITPVKLRPFIAFDPNLKLPYTFQWNVALEQGLGRQQMVSLSYIGAVGRRLIQTAFITRLGFRLSGNPNVRSAQLISNASTSDYHALQLQFYRRLSGGLQALASYTWSHSIDTASAGSAFNSSNALVPTLNPNANRGPSDFDIRHSFSAALTYDIPACPQAQCFRERNSAWLVRPKYHSGSVLPTG